MAEQEWILWIRMVVTFLATCLQVLPIKEWIRRRLMHGEIGDHVPIKTHLQLQQKYIETQELIEKQNKELSALRWIAVIILIPLLLKNFSLVETIKNLNESLKTHVCFCPDYNEGY